MNGVLGRWFCIRWLVFMWRGIPSLSIGRSPVRRRHILVWQLFLHPIVVVVWILQIIHSWPFKRIDLHPNVACIGPPAVYLLSLLWFMVVPSRMERRL